MPMHVAKWLPRFDRMCCGSRDGVDHVLLGSGDIHLVPVSGVGNRSFGLAAAG
jgi:hypothetical protein